LGDGEQQVYLENLTDELKLKDRVIFAGFVSREEIWNYYHDASAFILLSESEALGLVFWEAMYMKVPVIGSTAPGIVETIGKNADRGMLLQNGDNIEAVREKIDFCLTESPDRESMLLRAKEFVETQMSMKTNINNI
jgi:glycosyltransferase involved in cell wall biosynthesis